MRDMWRRRAPNWARQRWIRLAEARAGLPTRSWSYAGEDVILRRLLGPVKAGFYVDIGAHHPGRHSNTAWFYRRGWSGLNVDATPGSMRAFERRRRRDRNVEVAVGDEPGRAQLHVLSAGLQNTLAPNTMSPEFDGAIAVEVRTLADLLAAEGDRTIDFMSVDVEGHEIPVLRSNDWDRHRPRILAVEVHAPSLRQALEHPTARYAESLGYEPRAYNGLTLILSDRR